MHLTKVLPVLFASLVIAHASLLSISDAGNTQPGAVTGSCFSTPCVEGTVNFAVYKNSSSGSSDPDPFGTGYSGFKASYVAGTLSPAFDAAAIYLYVYETVNNGTNAINFPISQNTVALKLGQATSYGFFNGVGFVLSSGVLGSPAAGFSSPSPAKTGATPSVTAQSGLVAPTSVSLNGSSIAANYGVSGLTSGQISMLWGYTSNAPPVFVSTSIEDGGTSATGSVPGPSTVPEASTIYLTGAVGILIGLVSFWRRRLARSV